MRVSPCYDVPNPLFLHARRAQQRGKNASRGGRNGNQWQCPGLTDRFEWRGGGNNWFETARGLFAQPGNLLSPSYLWMLRDIRNFAANQQSVEDYAAGKLAGLTLGEYFRTTITWDRLA